MAKKINNKDFFEPDFGKPLIEVFKDIQKEIDESNSKKESKGASLLNGRRQTNIGLYRKYIEFYLRNHADINNEFMSHHIILTSI